MKTLQESFSVLKDYRREKSITYPMIEILTISLCAIICGAETWNEIETFGNTRQDWLKRIIKMDNGCPRHDTFNRFFSNINPIELERCFVDWISSISSIKVGDIISIDGKTIRGAKRQGTKSLIHMVSAWANESGLSLGQVKVDEKSNEMTAIPKLLEVLDIEGCFVTIDAMGCQTGIARQIDEDKDAFYVLAVKENQKELYRNIEESFRFLTPSSTSEHLDSNHGRVEERRCSIIKDLSFVEKSEKWTNLESLIRIEANRYIKATGRTEKSTRYYISNSNEGATHFNQIVREHWAIENNLHWQLDVSFNEDKLRKRHKNATQNFSLFNKIALALLKHENTQKKSIRLKRFTAAINTEYLEKIIGYARKN